MDIGLLQGFRGRQGLSRSIGGRLPLPIYDVICSPTGESSNAYLVRGHHFNTLDYNIHRLSELCAPPIATSALCSVKLWMVLLRIFLFFIWSRIETPSLTLSVVHWGTLNLLMKVIVSDYVSDRMSWQHAPCSSGTEEEDWMKRHFEVSQ